MISRPSPLKNNVIALTVALIAIVVFFGWRFYSVKIQDPQDRVLINPAQALTDFSLVDANDKPFTLDNLTGKWTFLFFGYTSCPDVCPTTLSEMVTVKKLLSNLNEQKQIQFVFISVDPQRDPPEHLKNFISYFNKDFVGVTGSIENLNKLTTQIGIKHRRLTEQGGEYLVEHSSDILLFNPAARLYAKFPAPHYSKDIAELFTNIQIKHRE